MRRALKAAVLAATVAVVSAPALAHAEGYISPWVSANAGSSFDNGRAGFGVNAGGMGAGIIGGEVDFGWSPSFFGTQNDFGNNSVIDLMGNVIVGVPVGGTHGAGIRPFLTAGVGLRGDIKYLRSFEDLNTGVQVIDLNGSNQLHFWRAAVGVVLR